MKVTYISISILVLVTVSIISHVQCAGIEAFFDNMMKAAIDQKKEFIDPFKLENITLDFGPHLGPFHVKGEAKLFNISLRGLSSIKRIGDLKQLKSGDGKFKTTRVRMTVGPLNFTSRGVTRLAGIAIRRNFLGLIDRMDCVTTMIGFKSDQSVKVTKYEIKELEGLRLKSMDRKLSDPITNRLISGVLGLFRARVEKAMQMALKVIIVDKINDLPPAFKSLMIN